MHVCLFRILPAHLKIRQKYYSTFCCLRNHANLLPVPPVIAEICSFLAGKHAPLSPSCIRRLTARQAAGSLSRTQAHSSRLGSAARLRRAAALPAAGPHPAHGLTCTPRDLGPTWQPPARRRRLVRARIPAVRSRSHGAEEKAGRPREDPPRARGVGNSVG
jgi:hypothetical protein